MPPPDLTVHDEPAESRYTLRLGEQVVGLADYSIDGDVVTVPHVETNPAYRGRGFASVLMDGVIASIRAQNRQIRPLCSFAASHMQDRPESHDLVVV